MFSTPKALTTLFNVNFAQINMNIVKFCRHFLIISLLAFMVHIQFFLLVSI